MNQIQGFRMLLTSKTSGSHTAWILSCAKWKAAEHSADEAPSNHSHVSNVSMCETRETKSLICNVNGRVKGAIS